MGELLRAIDGYQGEPVTAAALKLAPLTFVRPGELRGAEWREFDLGGAEWRIPGGLGAIPAADAPFYLRTAGTSGTSGTAQR